MGHASILNAVDQYRYHWTLSYLPAHIRCLGSSWEMLANRRYCRSRLSCIGRGSYHRLDVCNTGSIYAV